MLTGSLPKQVEYRKLARDRTRLAGDLSIVQLSRFADCLASHQGQVQVTLKFVKGKGGTTRVVGDASTEVTVTCQYCLEEMKVPVEASINLLIVESTEALLALPQGQDGLVCETEHLQLIDVFEDELIVNLPMVPKHTDGQCLDVAGYVPTDVPGRTGEEPTAETHRPFAGLKKDLNLKRS
ncbi:MAG: YceD family protein [Pseudomonadales bacterium]